MRAHSCEIGRCRSRLRVQRRSGGGALEPATGELHERGPTGDALHFAIVVRADQREQSGRRIPVELNRDASAALLTLIGAYNDGEVKGIAGGAALVELARRRFQRASARAALDSQP